jgi:DGQHR domain-containing protein
MIPNALVIAFDDRVRFESNGDDQEAYTKIGHLVVPVDPTLADEDKPGWVVDGQQRLAAIRDADIDSFPICVVSFIASDYVEQREQFILVNSTKPLPKGLIYELLPSTQTLLPSLLQKRRFPSLLLSRLNADDDSPLKGMIKTPTAPDGIIKDNSILRMLENSLSDGALYRYRSSLDGGPEIETMLTLLRHFWGAVAELFEDAWGESPRRSRLMHGAGVVSLGFLMDAIADRHRGDVPSTEQFLDDLRPIQSICRWTDGYWDFGPGMQRKWNEIQNTHKDIQLLANHLLVQYKATVWSKPKSRPGA